MEFLHLFDHDPKRMPVRAGQELFAQGNHRDVMYAVVAGEVEIRIDGEVVELAGPGAIVGEMALVEDGPRTTTVLARSDAEVVPIDKERFLFLVQQTPFFALKVMAILANRLRRMNQRYEALQDAIERGPAAD